MSTRYKMAAIDLDGTLLGPDGQISPANRFAVQRLQRAGVEVVLASGRHYQSMRPFAEDLPGIQWLVSCQGGELCNVARTTVLAADFLPPARVREMLAQGRALGLSTVAYATDGVFTDSDWNADLQFYTDLSGCRPESGQPQESKERQFFKVIWMGTPQAIDQAVHQHPALSAGVQMIRTHARFLEFMPDTVSKASALQQLAARLDIQAPEVITFGDGDNDVPMLEWAGISVAMAHGWPAALQAATYVTPAGPAETAFARGVELVFAKHITPAAEAASECVATMLAA